MTANFGKYSLFLIRRERVFSLVALAGFAVFAAIIAGVYPGVFPDTDALLGMAATMNTPSMVAMMGPVYGLDKISAAIVMAQECLIWYALAAVIVNAFLINRHTRADEELGRFEMLAALPVGRLTNNASAICMAFLFNLLLALIIALVTFAFPIGGLTLEGALVYGLSAGAQGFVFAAVTLLCAQLFSTARGSIGASFVVLGVMYILRAQGDMTGNELLACISPLGLGLRVEAFYSNNLWPVIVLFFEGAVVSALALVIGAKRDVGMGVFPARKGRANASRFLRGLLGLAWRLTRGGALAWCVGIFAISAAYGAVVGELDTFIQGNNTMAQLIGTTTADTLVDAFIAMLNTIMSLIISVPLIFCVNRLRAEERRGRLEQVLALSQSRTAMFFCYIVIAIGQTVMLTFLNALGLYAAGSSTGLVDFGTLMASAFVYLPAMFVMIGFTVLLAGCAPKLSPLVWVLYGYAFTMFLFGRLFDVPDWALRISPFASIPQIPIAEMSAAPLVTLCIVAAAMCAAGLYGFTKRDSK
jgi:ABC-2 type transport system permease protein